MAEIINGVPIGDLPGIGSVPDDSMLVVEFLGKAYHMPGAVLRQMIQDVLDSMGDSVDDVTEARLTAAIETVLASGKYNGVSPSVEVLDEEDGTSVIHIIDAFGDKRYPVEVKGATDAVRYKPQSLTDAQKKQARENIDVSPGTITVKLSGSVTGGFDVVLNGESVTNEPLDRLAEEGYRVVGVAISEVKVLNYKVPAGTLFEYTNVFEFEDNSVVGSQNTRRFVFRVQVDDCNFTLRCTDGVWGGILQPIQATFFLKRNNGVPFIQYNGKTILPEDANWLSVQLILCEVQHRPVFCFQGDMQFFTDNNTAIQPPWGTAFSLRINDDNDYYFATEYDGYELQLLISPDGFVNSARKTSVYKAVESKADDLKAEDGTLFLLSAGEPIGAGVPLPTGNADDCKIFIADLNTSTYEDIKAADDAGKICYALWGGYTACMLTTLSPESAIFTTLLDPHLGLYVKFTKGTVGVSDFGLTESHSVLYEPQSLTDAQKAQARENIGALSEDDIEQVLQDVGAGNVYVAGLFSAKYAEVKAAYEAGKACFVTYGALLCPLTVLDEEKAEFVGMLTPHMGIKGILYADGTYNFQYVYSNAVQTVEQSLTEEKKAQARANIGALSTGDVDTVLQQAKDSGQFDGPAGPAGPAGATGKTAYAYAQDGGYTGTETEFAAKLAETGTGNVYVISLFSAKYAEVKAAYDAGKACFVTYGALLCPLTVLDEEKAEFVGMLTPNMGIKGTVPAEGTIDWTYVRSNAVQTVSQTLSDDQKAQARTNIGAMAGSAAGTDSILPARLRSFQEESVKIGDPDYATETGFYYVYGWNNRPPFSQSTNIDYRVLTTAHSSNWLQQIATDFRCGDMFLRRRENGTWTPWVRFATAGDLSSYLPLGGGLMTGSLKFQASSLPQKSLEYICGIDAFANGGEMGWQSKAEFLSGYATTGGNVNTSTMPLGFASRTTGATWGNTIGTSFTSWNDPTGGSIDFRQDNPSSGKMSIKVDGRVYVNEGNNPVMGTEQVNGYWGMTSPDGENNTWIRTTSAGILPYQEGGAGSGHCYLGTSGWYFGESYIDRMHGTNLTLSGRAYMNDWIQCNAEAGLLFPNHNGLHIMPNTVSHYTPLRIVGERNGYNGVLFGSDTTGLHVMSQSEHQGFYNQSTDCWITYYNRVNNKIGIGTSGWDSYSLLTIGGATYVRGPVKINGVEVDDGSGQLAMLKALSTNTATSGGSWIGRAMFGAKNLTFLMGTYNGLAGIGAHSWSDAAAGTGAAWAPMYFNPDGAAPMYFGANGPGWTADRGTLKVQGSNTSGGGAVDVYGTLRVNGVRAATVNDLTSAAAPLRVNYNTTSQTVDKTHSEIKAAWDAGRSVVLTDGTSVYPLSYVDASEVIFSGFSINANSKYFFDSVHINSSGKVRYYSYSN